VAVDPIRIRISAREPKPLKEGSPRVAFWVGIRDPNDSDQSIDSLEGKLCREFGRELRRALLEELAEPLRTLDSGLFGGPFRDLEHWLFRLSDRPRSDGDPYGYQLIDALSRILEQRQQLIRDSAGLRRVQERLTLAAGITFSTRVASYSSLNLDVVPGSVKQIAAAFENDFDSFRVFLEAFVPVAFAEVFSGGAADKLEFAVSVPASTERAFQTIEPSAVSPATPPGPTVIPNQTPARERAEWLWRLANGSLLIPVLLALVVMYFGLKALTDSRAIQYEALKPILDHQLKLLEEDGRRLSRDSAAPVKPTSAKPGD